jgi:hypothetical protein
MYWELDNEPFFYQNNPKEFANTDDYLAKMKPYNDAIKSVLLDAKTLISYESTEMATRVTASPTSPRRRRNNGIILNGKEEKICYNNRLTGQHSYHIFMV